MKNDIKKAPKKTSKVVTSSGKGVKITKREVLPFCLAEIVKEETYKDTIIDLKEYNKTLWAFVIVLTLIVIGEYVVFFIK